MKILVIGSEGNIGSKLVPYLRLKKHSVFRCDIHAGSGNDYMVVNINSPTELAIYFKDINPDVVYHLAAMVSRVTCELSPSLTVETNLSGLYNVIHLCRKYGSRLIYFSTSEVYGNIPGVLSEERQDLNPNNIYGLTKYLGEKLVQYELTKGLDAFIVRPFMFYDEDETFGENRSAMIRFAEALLTNNVITVHKGSKRNWMHISDAIDVLERILYIDRFEIMNIGASEPAIETSELARAMCDYIGLEYSHYVNEIPIPSRMTLVKMPILTKQTKLTRHIDKVRLIDGIRLVINKVRKRI